MPETATEAPADDIRSTLAAAITEHETPEPKVEPKVEAKAEPEPEAAPELPLETEDKKTERAPDGKFAKKADEPVEPEAKAASAEEPEKAPEENALPAEIQKVLAGLKAADQEMFKKQSPEAQQFLARRHKEMTADYTKKLQDISRFKNDYEPVDKIFEPYKDVMKQKGFTIPALIESWSNVEKKLASGKQGALEVIGGLINGYNVPREDIAALIGVRQQASQTQTTEQPTAEQQRQQIQLPPEVLQELSTLKQAVTGLTAAQRQAQQAAINAQGEKAMRDIEAFKSEADAKGTLLRPHFDDVEQDMLRLANAAIAAKQPVPALAELYETAVWANPSTREKLLTAKQQAAEQARVDQDKAKSAAARKAAVSVTGAPGSGQATPIRNTPERSLREEIEERLAEQSAA